MRLSYLAPLAVFAATPLAAQDDCGGIATGGQWIGGSETASDITTSDAYREQMALVLSGNEYVSLFTLSAPTSVRIEAAGRGNGDPQIDLYGADGEIVASDDDSGGASAARIEETLDPGTYCAKLVSFDGSPMTAFVRVARDDQDALTAGMATPEPNPVGPSEDSVDAVPNLTCDTAIDMGTLDAALTNTGSADSAGMLAFTLSTAAAISITADNEEADPSITLISTSGDEIAENDDFDGLNSRIDVASALDAGRYCISVEALSDGTAPIDVTVSAYDPEAALAGLYARGESAPPLDGSFDVTDLGVLTNRLRHDVNAGDDATWFSVDIPDASLFLLETITADGKGDPWIALYDDLGRQVGVNDDNGDSLDSLITARVTAGTYLIAVKHVDGSQGFIRLAMERFIPAP